MPAILHILQRSPSVQLRGLKLEIPQPGLTASTEDLLCVSRDLLHSPS